MTADHRTRLTEAAADPAPEAALHALRWALDWSAAALRDLRTDDDDANDDETTMRAVIALDDALTGAGDLLAEIPGLADRGRAGRPVRDYLRDLGDRLAAAAEQVRVARADLDEASAGERALTGRLAEHDDLRRRVADLRRLARLATALDALAAQRTVIDQHVTRLTEQVGSTEPALATAAGELRRLTDEQLGFLSAPTRQALDAAEAAQRALAAEEKRAAEARATLAESTERAEQLRAERIERLAALAEHARADRAIADALGGASGGSDGLEQMRATLDEVDGRLSTVDSALSRALEASQARHAADHQPTNWS